MKNRIIALALAIVMLFALSACSKKQTPAPAPTEQPTVAPTSAPTEPPAEPSPVPTPEPVAEPVPTPAGIPAGSGVVSITSVGQGFSIDFNSDICVANELPNGSIRINAGPDEGIPYCTVTIAEEQLNGQENATDATMYLLGIAQGIKAELGDAVIQDPEQLPSPIEGRDLIGLSYAYGSDETEGNIWNVYYAENLENGKIAVFSCSAFENDMSNVNAILKLAIESFKLAE